MHPFSQLTLDEPPHALLVLDFTLGDESGSGTGHAGDAVAVLHVEVVAIRDASLRAVGLNHVQVSRLTLPQDRLQLGKARSNIYIRPFVMARHVPTFPD